jgi:hypothetical protein
MVLVCWLGNLQFTIYNLRVVEAAVVKDGSLASEFYATHGYQISEQMCVFGKRPGKPPQNAA